MSVTFAELRAATRKEVAEAKGGCLWQGASLVWSGLNKAIGTAILLYKGANVLEWSTPPPLAAAHSISHYMGWAPERGFLREFPSILGKYHYTSEEKVMKAFFGVHRSNELFQPSKSFEKMFLILKDCFPTSKFTKEDVMFTCGPENTQLYRGLIIKALKGEAMTKIIEEEMRSALDEWAKKCENGGIINATEETRHLASRIIIKLLLGREAKDRKMTEAVSYINTYIISFLTKKVDANIEQKYRVSLAIFRNTFNEILESREPIPLFEGSDLTLEQKQALVFVTFFAGQETVASLMNYILWQLAEGRDFRADTATKAHNAFIHAIHDFPPAYGVGRTLKTDVCLEYQLEGEEKIRKFIMFEGELLAARMFEAAQVIDLPFEDESKRLSHHDWLPFGDGPHKCPGQQLAEKEIVALISELKNGYQVSTDHHQTPKKIGLVTLQLSEDIKVKVTAL